MENDDLRYALEQMLLTMFPDERPVYPEGEPVGDRCEVRTKEGPERLYYICTLYFGEESYTGASYAKKSRFYDEITKKRMLSRTVQLAFYRAALKSGVEKPIWGSMTGVRPAKIMRQMLESGVKPGKAMGRFITDNGVNRSRARLCVDTALAGIDCKSRLGERDVCLYIGIPFCPSRCSYCSFVSQSVQKSMDLIPKFLEALYREMDEVGELLHKLSLHPVALYVGGGTPTVLSAEQLEELFDQMEYAFDFSYMDEITVEAGRPDTITAEKMDVLKAMGVGRVSVNPQSMDDRVLEAIGRKHTAQDIVNAMELVRSAGEFWVNMDIIAGLPGDTPEGFAKTVEKILELDPENITVHTLSLKNGSEITLENTPRPDGEQVGDMLYFANTTLRDKGYRPYYLYRQKFMSGGFENVGWQRDDTASIYNICTMEELCSIFAMGGGASTKICLDKGRIERVFNPKYAQEYIEGIDKVLESKRSIEELLTSGI